MSRKFLFVSGCPRSGTTVLTHILNWSDAIFVGQERFGALLNRSPEHFTPSLFDPRRLSRFERGDCAYASFESNAEYSTWYANPKPFAQLERMTQVGDKMINLYRHFNVFSRPGWVDQDVTILHIVRNVFDVAASYHTRKQDPSDGWQRDFLQAITEWTESVDNVHDLCNQPLQNVRLGIVNYDTIFDDNFDHLLQGSRMIYGFVREEFGAKQVRGMERLFLNSKHRLNDRQVHDDIRGIARSRVSSEVLSRYRELAEISIP